MSTAWFSKALLPWYRVHHRSLPWRDTTDPYRIWLSEVILQQTRVDQGLAYWERFVERYPTVADLAAANEDEVLRLWQGLGYYSRARNLLTAARQVMEEHGGEFPLTYAQLKGLKGVGEYTAAAIGSIAFGLPEPVVDGNVYRVLARIFGIDTPIDSTKGRKEFRTLAAKLLDTRHPGDHNQAVMELGATVCTPKNPQCERCPLVVRCIARSTGRIAELPVKAGKTKVRTRHFNYLHIEAHNGIYLRKRDGKDIWQGLWELPLIETEKAVGSKAINRLVWEVAGMKMQGTKEGRSKSGKKQEGGSGIGRRLGPVKHVLSHQVIQAVFWHVVAPKRFKAPKEWSLVTMEGLNERALPRLIERYLQADKAKEQP